MVLFFYVLKLNNNKNHTIYYYQAPHINNNSYLCKKFGTMGKMNITAATRRGNDAFHELIDRYKDKRIYNRILIELRFWWQDTKRFINAATPWKDAQGDDLPPIDKEVIVIVDYNAQLNIHGEEQPMYRVEFAHRPNKYTKVWNPDLGEQQVVEVERFGKGEWNTPHVVWWLDAPLPFKEG